MFSQDLQTILPDNNMFFKTNNIFNAFISALTWGGVHKSRLSIYAIVLL